MKVVDATTTITEELQHGVHLNIKMTAPDLPSYDLHSIAPVSSIAILVPRLACHDLGAFPLPSLLLDVCSFLWFFIFAIYYLYGRLLKSVAAMYLRNIQSEKRKRGSLIPGTR
jgi:hypothetical protein